MELFLIALHGQQVIRVLLDNFAGDALLAYSGEDEHRFRTNVNT
jgi:hypothetical protein